MEYPILFHTISFGSSIIHVHCRPFIMLYFGYIEMNRVISELCYKGMHGSRKFCQKKSKFDTVFFNVVGRDDSSTTI